MDIKDMLIGGVAISAAAARAPDCLKKNCSVYKTVILFIEKER